MCINCELKKAAEAAENRNTEVIGTVSPLLRADFAAYVKAESLAELEADQLVLNARLAMLLGEIDEAEIAKRQAVIDEQLEADQEKYEAQRTALWDRIYDELGLVGKDRKRTYTIDRETGEVTAKKRRGIPHNVTD